MEAEEPLERQDGTENLISVHADLEVATSSGESLKRKLPADVTGQAQPAHDEDEVTGNNEDAEGWQVVTRAPKKRRKKKKNGGGGSSQAAPNAAPASAVTDGPVANSSSTQPALRYAELHRLKSMVKIADLQNLALYCIADDVAPQWISVQNHTAVRKVVLLLVPGLERGMFTGEIPLLEEEPTTTDAKTGDAAEENGLNGSHPHGLDSEGFLRVSRHPDEYLPTPMGESKLPPALRPLANIFDQLWPVKAPGDEKYNRLYSPIHTMLSSSVPKSQSNDEKRRANSGGARSTPSKDVSAKRTRITSYLASNDDLYDSEYALHPASVPSSERGMLMQRREQNEQDEAHGWRDSAVEEFYDGDVPEAEVEHGSITAGRTVYTIDCEMCMVGEEFALTRISMVDWDGEVVLDELVKPERPITNYLTQYSGITAEKLAGVTTTLQDIQARLLALLNPRTILAGHSLESDLRALKLTHPFIVDTSFLYPHPRGPPLRSSLKWLSQKYLGREIQKGHGSSGHDSVEDARATLALIKQKCERGPEWGAQGGAQQESIFKRISRSRGRLEAGGADEAHKGLARTAGAIVDHGTPERSFSNMAPYYVNASDDAGVVAGVQRAVHGDVDGAYIPGGGVAVTWARLRELETLRGWVDDKTTGKATEKATDNENGEEDTEPAAAPATLPPPPAPLAGAVARTVACIAQVHALLPPCALLVVYSGTGDPRALKRLQDTQRQFRREYAVKKWDELSVQWTDVEDQALRKACGEARRGIGFVAIT